MSIPFPFFFDDGIRAVFNRLPHKRNILSTISATNNIFCIHEYGWKGKILAATKFYKNP